jgi:lipid-A-disaccharide synthase
MPPTILISCGEPSGDLYAAALTRELRGMEPAIRVLGLGGRNLRDGGAELVGDYEALAVTGIVEALRVLPRSLGMYRRLVRRAREVRPDVLVAIDFPDFNFRLARALKRQGVKVVYYIPPQLWAWRSGRMRTLRKLADRILVIFPFEPEIYRLAGTPATFVGHPLVGLAKATVPRTQFLERVGLDSRYPVVGLLPGSRPNEVRAILPTLAASTEIISAAVPGVQYLVARAPNLSPDLFEAAKASDRMAISEGHADEVLSSSDVVITASGTATVQAAIHECPMVIVYRVAPATYALGRRFLRVDTFGMVNLVAGSRVMPELIQDRFTADATAREALRLLKDPAAREQAAADLRAVKAKLGGEGASRRAAEAVLEVALGR